MCKRISLFISILLTLFITTTVYAESSFYIVLNGTTVGVRTGPSTGYTKIGTVNTGQSYTLLETNPVADEKKNGDCDAGWWKVSYDNQPAFICSEYATRFEKSTSAETGVAGTSCETEMQQAGFPSSYWSGLCSMKTTHPSWNFKALNTGLDWATVVSKESACGKSYIATSNQSYIDSSCKNQYTKTWYPASQTAVAYYMDPRNWLAEKYVFQFEYLKYEGSMENNYKNGIANMLKGTEFYKYHSGIGNDLSTIITQAGKDTDVSPIFLASRMKQELGTGTSLYNLYSGVTQGWESLYNFFNYGVTDSCATTSGITACGLSYARNNGWTSPYNAIKGASSSLSSSYISVGQYTTYLQKYNVVPTQVNKLYLHQYMTNVAAPSSESTTAYNTYKNLGILDSGFMFYIPVYNNMSNQINNTPAGGTGDTSTTNTVTSVSTDNIVAGAGFKINGSSVYGIGKNKSVAEFASSINSVGGTVKVTKADGTEIKDGKVGTGMKAVVSNSSGSKTYTIVIKGDTSGDGNVNALDLLQIQKYILSKYDMNGAYLQAADPSGDGKVNALDLLQVQKSIIGKYTIE